MVPHQPNIALGYCVKFPRCILIYDAGGLFISYSDNTTICKFRRNIRFPILLLFYPAFLMRTAWLLSIKPGFPPDCIFYFILLYSIPFLGLHFLFIRLLIELVETSFFCAASFIEQYSATTIPYLSFCIFTVFFFLKLFFSA